jgi:two-component system, OmpR family, sensor histidine kinase VicK
VSNKKSTTEIVYGNEKIVDRIVQFMQKAQRRIDICVDNTQSLLVIEFKQIRDAFIDAKRRGITIRYITEITKTNLGYCRELMSIVDELRHLDGVKGNFCVTEQEYVAPSTFHKKERGKFAKWMICSNVKEIVEHQQYVFDSFWNTSSSAERKLTEIRNDVSLGITEIIDDPSRTQRLFIDLIKSAKSEVLLMLPTVNSFMREYRIGVIQLLEELSTHHKGRTINIRILTPINNTIEKILEEMKIKTNLLEEPDIYYNSNLKLRHLESEPNLSVTTATILLVDRKVSLAIEKVNDLSEHFTEAVGLSTYSTSEPTVVSYISIFENFWNQLELYQKLKQHDKMQQEFINIAAHELRTPAQSILGFTELAKIDPDYVANQPQSFVDGMYRNALRIQKLTKDILDVTRIESNTLRLSKIKFGLNEVIVDAIEDIKLMLVPESNQVKLKFKNMNTGGEEVISRIDDIFVVADKNRIIQVITNLLDNALKFTPKGVVSVVVARKKTQKDHQEEAIITVEDTGPGIHPEIFPKLFTKFSTKSFSGTGLGLYISNIIKAHCGRIWAQNNNGQGKSGATFSFSLPLN